MHKIALIMPSTNIGGAERVMTNFASGFKENGFEVDLVLVDSSGPFRELIPFEKNPYKYMKRASVLVLSSVYEGFSNVLVEAMALGTSVVSTNCQSGPAEILDNGLYGPLVDVGNPHKNILMQRGMEFSLDKITSQYINLFKN